MRVRGLFRRRLSRARFERDMTDELRDHLERRAADLERGGLTADEAHRRARIEFGAIEAYKEQLREVRPWLQLRNLPEQILREVSQASRRLRATPVFTIFAIVSLAIGVGITTSVYSVLHFVLWRPSGIAAPDRVVVLTHAEGGRSSWQGSMARPDFDDLRASQRTLTSVESSMRFSQVLGVDDLTDALDFEGVTGDYFGVLGVRASAGRVLQPADDRPDAGDVVVLSHQFWSRKLRGDLSIVGRVVRIGGQPCLVIGIADRSYRGLSGFVGLETDAWVARSAIPRVGGPSVRTSRRDLDQWVFGRLMPGQHADEVAAEAGVLGARLDTVAPMEMRVSTSGPSIRVPRAWSAYTLPDADAELQSRAMPFGVAIMGLVSLVLVVACTNLANLALGRGSARQAEFALRRALGASRWRLVRELCVESGIVAVCGGVCAVLLTRAMLVLLSVEFPVSRGRMARLEPVLNLPALAIGAAAVLLALFVCGLAPALHLTRASLRTRMTSPTEGPPLRWRLRRSLIGWQVAISSGLFLVAALSLRVVVAGALHDPGIDLDRLAVGGISFYTQRWDEPRSRRAIDAVIAHGADLAGAGAVALSSGVPFGWNGTMRAEVTTPDRPFTPSFSGETVYSLAATPQVFQVLDVPILRGRPWTGSDAPGAPGVAVLSERAATQVFGTSDVIGRRILVRFSSLRGQAVRDLEVIGVARETDTGSYFSTASDVGVLYVPLSQQYEPSLLLLARAKAGFDPAGVAAGMSAMVRRADPDLAVNMPTAARPMLTGQYVVLRPFGLICTGLASTALVLAMCGLYGVLSHVVAQRTREMGIRMALGAGASGIRRLVFRDGLRPVIEGIILGLAIGWLGRMVVRAVYNTSGISVIDPIAFSLVPVPLILAGILACYFPARRATRVEPNVALRDL